MGFSAGGNKVIHPACNRKGMELIGLHHGKPVLPGLRYVGVIGLLVFLILPVLPAMAQRGPDRGRMGDVIPDPSHFTIARLKYPGGGDWYWGSSALPNVLDYIEQNHEAYAQQHAIVAASAVTRLVRAPARDIVPADE